MSRSKAEIAARLPQFLRLSARAGFLLATSASFLVLGVRGTQNAVANGDTRTITIKPVSYTHLTLPTNREV